MGVPEPLFFGVEPEVETLGDHVFDSEELCVFFVGVVEEALSDLATVEGGAVVVHVEVPGGVVGEDVKGVEVVADVRDGRKVLWFCGLLEMWTGGWWN